MASSHFLRFVLPWSGRRAGRIWSKLFSRFIQKWCNLLLISRYYHKQFCHAMHVEINMTFDVMHFFLLFLFWFCQIEIFSTILLNLVEKRHTYKKDNTKRRGRNSKAMLTESCWMIEQTLKFHFEEYEYQALIFARSWRVDKNWLGL